MTSMHATLLLQQRISVKMTFVAPLSTSRSQHSGDSLVEVSVHTHTNQTKSFSSQDKLHYLEIEHLILTTAALLLLPHKPQTAEEEPFPSTFSHRFCIFQNIKFIPDFNITAAREWWS